MSANHDSTETDWSFDPPFRVDAWPVPEYNHDSTQSGFPLEAEESYCQWLNERDHQQAEHDEECRFWSKQALLQAETDG